MTITIKELPYIIEILNGVLKSRKVDGLSKFVFCNENDFRKIDTRMLVHPLIDHTFDNAAAVNAFISATEGMAVVEMEQEILEMQYEMHYSLDNLSIRIDGINELINKSCKNVKTIDDKMNLILEKQQSDLKLILGKVDSIIPAQESKFDAILEKQESNFNELKNLIIDLSLNNKPATEEVASTVEPKIVGDTENSLSPFSTEVSTLV